MPRPHRRSSGSRQTSVQAESVPPLLCGKDHLHRKILRRIARRMIACLIAQRPIDRMRSRRGHHRQLHREVSGIHIQLLLRTEAEAVRRSRRILGCLRLDARCRLQRKLRRNQDLRLRRVASSHGIRSARGSASPARSASLPLPPAAPAHRSHTTSAAAER